MQVVKVTYASFTIMRVGKVVAVVVVVVVVVLRAFFFGFLCLACSSSFQLCLLAESNEENESCNFLRAKKFHRALFCLQVAKYSARNRACDRASNSKVG